MINESKFGDSRKMRWESWCCGFMWWEGTVGMDGCLELAIALCGVCLLRWSWAILSAEEVRRLLGTDSVLLVVAFGLFFRLL